METLIRNGFLMLWVLLCGASVEILILRQSVETVANIFAHTSLRLRPRPARMLGWLFITPNLHHAHHHFQMPATNCNYGDVFSIWDRLFGTFINLSREETVFGLDTQMGVLGFGRETVRATARPNMNQSAKVLALPHERARTISNESEATLAGEWHIEGAPGS